MENENSVEDPSKTEKQLTSSERTELENLRAMKRDLEERRFILIGIGMAIGARRERKVMLRQKRKK